MSVRSLFGRSAHTARSGVSSPARGAASWVLTAVALGLMLWVTWIRRGTIEFPGVTLTAFTLIAWSPLLLRGCRPFVALAGTVLFESVHLIVVPIGTPEVMDAGLRMGAYQPVPIATMIAAFTVASRRPRWLGWAAGAGAGLILLVVSVLAAPLLLLATDIVMFNLVVIATAVGVAVKTRADRLQRKDEERAAATRQAVLDERLRIAQEMHDVLAHHLTVINAQAAVAEYLLKTNPETAATALNGMSTHSAKAIDELRIAVGLLRDPETTDVTSVGPDPLSPRPGIDQLGELVDSVRSTGTSVDLQISGSPTALSEMSDLAAYRIVQEALTNATKHAPGVRIHVRMEWAPTQLELTISNPIDTPSPAPVAAGTGHGLIGMRERAQAAGGTLTHADELNGTFIVRAVLPNSSSSVAAATAPRKGAD